MISLRYVILFFTFLKSLTFTSPLYKEFRGTWVITWEYITASQTADETMNRIDQIMDNHVAANMNAVFFRSDKAEHHTILLAMNLGVTTQGTKIQVLIHFNMQSTQRIIEDLNYMPGLMYFKLLVCMKVLLLRNIQNGFVEIGVEIL